MWTPATRGRMAEIEKKTKRYPTDLTDEEWARIEPFLPGAAQERAAGPRTGCAMPSRSSATPITTRSSNACRAAARPPIRRNTRRSAFGDYAPWFAGKHMANEPALPDAIIAPGEVPLRSTEINRLTRGGSATNWASAMYWKAGVRRSNDQVPVSAQLIDAEPLTRPAGGTESSQTPAGGKRIRTPGPALAKACAGCCRREMLDR
jgi:hypothetical protein